MPLVQLANGPLSATGPAAEVELDEIDLDQKETSEEFIMPVTTEEKADPSHFALLKVLGQERLQKRLRVTSPAYSPI